MLFPSLKVLFKLPNSRIFYLSLINCKEKKEYPYAGVFFLKIDYGRALSDTKKLWNLYGQGDREIIFISLFLYKIKKSRCSPKTAPTINLSLSLSVCFFLFFWLFPYLQPDILIAPSTDSFFSSCPFICSLAFKSLEESILTLLCSLPLSSMEVLICPKSFTKSPCLKSFGVSLFSP